MKLEKGHITLLSGLPHLHEDVGAPKRRISKHWHSRLQELMAAGYVKEETAYRVTKAGRAALAKAAPKEG